jgi:hypothetical protein
VIWIGRHKDSCHTPLALLLLGPVPLLSPLALLFLYSKVANVALFCKEGLHLDRLLELLSVCCVQGSRGSRLARDLNTVLLVCVLPHVCTVSSDKAAAVAILHTCLLLLLLLLLLVAVEEGILGWA